jgi:hypothetical protein
MRGIFEAGTDTAFSAGTYQTVTQPPLFRAANSLVYNAVSSLIVREFGCDLGNRVVARLNANAADALAGFHVVDRAMTARFVCEDPLVATANFETDWVAGVANARVLDAQVGTVQYNRIELHIDRFAPGPPPPGDVEGFRVVTVEGVVSNEGTERLAHIYD